MNRLILLVIILLAFAFPAEAARLDTSFTFSTIETPHFSIHFHQGLEEIAQRAARLAEDAHTRLTASFDWEPQEKTQMVLIDDTDFTNGFATPLPYNTVFIQVVPPAIDSTLGEYDDWLKEIIFHEYAHIVTSDPARGYSRITRAIFGKPAIPGDIISLAMFIFTAPPNVFMPHWWHEGMATWSETEFTGAGRGRSATYEMILRSAVAADDLPSIDKVNGEVPYWPNGHLPYIFGLRLTKFIADKYGKEALGKLSLAQAGRLPYAIGAPPRKICGGKDYAALYRDMLDDLKREEKERIAILGKAPFTQIKFLSAIGENLTNPRFSPDGKRLAFNVNDPHGHSKTVITGRDGAGIQAEFRRQFSDQGLSWSPDGSRIYFAQAEVVRGFDIYQDLYAYDLGEKAVRRLTRGLRVKDPEISPDGKYFALAVSGRGSQNLALLDARATLGGRDDLKPTPLTAYRDERVATPRWSPDSQTIAYTVTDNRGKTSLRLYDLQNGRDRALFTAGYNAAYPSWSMDGRVIYYVSDETGVYNLFAYVLKEEKSYQVSHLLGGAMQPDAAPDGGTLVFSSYTAKGFNIASLALDRRSWTVQRGPSIAPYWQDSTPAATEPPPAADNPASGNGPLAATPYSPWSTLYPRFWLPRIYGEDQDHNAYGAFTAGQDVLGYNSYLAELTYGTGHHRLYYNLTYRNDYLYPSFLLQGYARPVLYSDLLQHGDYYELNRSLVLETSVPLNFLESSYRFFFGYHLQDQSARSSLQDGLFNGLPVFQGRRDNIFAGIEFSDALKYPYSVSHEEGRTISLTYRNYSRQRGADLDGEEYLASYTEYLRLPSRPLRQHVLVCTLKGGIATGERTAQQAFQLGGEPGPPDQFSLRGYPARFETGKYVATGTLEYRAPLLYLLRGFGANPLFLDRLHGAVFTDVGEVWDDQSSFKPGRLKVGAGVEERLDMTLGYWLKITPAIGYAHGFNEGGEDRIYFTIYANL